MILECPVYSIKHTREHRCGGVRKPGSSHKCNIERISWAGQSWGGRTPEQSSSYPSTGGAVASQNEEFALIMQLENLDLSGVGLPPSMQNIHVYR